MGPTPLSVVQGETYSLEVRYAGTEDPPVPRSLAGYRARMQVRSRDKLTAPLVLDLNSNDGGGIVVEPLDETSTPRTGVVTVRISAPQTELLVKPTYYYDLFVIDRSDETKAIRLVHGVMSVDQSVTVLAEASP